ncbi:hypothetical protein JHK82_016527 [Glycine max]|nr:hypothetical protein JHK82_016527 [Glycine max]
MESLSVFDPDSYSCPLTLRIVTQLSTFLSHRHSFVTPTYGGHHDSGHSFCGGAPLAYCDSGNTNVESAGYYVVPDVTTDVENTFSKSDVIPVFERHPSTSVVWLAPILCHARALVVLENVDQVGQLKMFIAKE